MEHADKLNRLIWAMGQHEGWFEIGHPKYPNGSVAYRHHNPLNLRRSKFATRIVNNFAVFESDMAGIEAARWDITQKAKGNTSTGLTGKHTIADLIAVWAPVSDGNAPKAYAKHVSELTGFPLTMTLDELINS